MSYQDVQVAPPMDSHFKDAANTATMTPEMVQKVAVSPTANFNAAAPQGYNPEGTPSVGVNQNPELLAQVENAALLAQVQPQVSGLGADIFGACCSGLEKAIEPVQEIVAPQPANLPTAPEVPQMKYTLPEPGMVGPGGMAA